MEPFTDKARYLRRYAARTRERRAAAKRGWPASRTDIVAELKAWFEPLLELAGQIREGVGGPVMLQAGDDSLIVIDFPARQVRAYAGETCRYQFTVPRPLIESLIADHQTDWVNSLFLSMRFRPAGAAVQRVPVHVLQVPGPDRMTYAEGWYAEQEHDERESSSETGSSSGGAPLGPTSAGSARPTAPCSPARCTAGSSTWPTGRCLATDAQHAPPPQPSRPHGSQVSPRARLRSACHRHRPVRAASRPAGRRRGRHRSPGSLAAPSFPPDPPPQPLRNRESHEGSTPRCTQYRRDTRRSPTAVREFAPDVNRGVSSQIARLCTRAPVKPALVRSSTPRCALPTASSTSPSTPVPAAAWPC